MATIETRIENERGCGFRKPGGLYLVGGRFTQPCGKLPIELDVCPCCNSGIKQSRGMTFVSGLLIKDKKCSGQKCNTGCSDYLFNQDEYGLMWIGEKYYPNPSDFTKEGRTQGISKRIAQIPKKLVVGKTVVLLAHPKAISVFTPEDTQSPVKHKKGIFSAFIPERIEYVVKGTETEEELNNMESRGITLVKVIKNTDAQISLEVHISTEA